MENFLHYIDQYMNTICAFLDKQGVFSSVVERQTSVISKLALLSSAGRGFKSRRTLFLFCVPFSSFAFLHNVRSLEHTCVGSMSKKGRGPFLSFAVFFSPPFSLRD